MVRYPEGLLDDSFSKGYYNYQVTLIFQEYFPKNKGW